MPELPTHPGHPRWQSPDDRLRLVLEVIVVLLVGVVPYLVSALTAPGSMRSDAGDDHYALAAGLHRGAVILQIVAPVLFLMWRSGRGWSYFGITPPRWRVDLPGAVLYVLLGWISFYVFWIGLGIVSMVIPPLNAAMWSMGDTAAHRQTTATIQATPTFLLIAMMVANGFAEELVTKAYLIPRLRELLGGTWIAILLSAVLFGSYHVYQGWIAAAGVCFSQILMGWLFTKMGRIWPFALGHALYDLVLVVMHT